MKVFVSYSRNDLMGAELERFFKALDQELKILKGEATSVLFRDVQNFWLGPGVGTRPRAGAEVLSPADGGLLAELLQQRILRQYPLVRNLPSCEIVRSPERKFFF
jgi:hypothetical protein